MKTILLIDDDANLRLLFSTVLSSSYNVLEAGNGKDGMSLLEQYKPDLVITDLKMPGVTEFEIIHVIRLKDSRVKIIACSGRFNQGRIDELALMAGADLCLSKPTTLDDLERAVATLLG